MTVSLWTKIKSRIKGFRTIAFNLFAMVFPIISLTEWHSVIPKDWLPVYILVVAIGNIILRSVTNTSIGKSK